MFVPPVIVPRSGERNLSHTWPAITGLPCDQSGQIKRRDEGGTKSLVPRTVPDHSKSLSDSLTAP
jgi:hypothetical protein